MIDQQHAIQHPAQATIQYLQLLRTFSIVRALGFGSIWIAATLGLPENVVMACIAEAGDNMAPFHSAFDTSESQRSFATRILLESWTAFATRCGVTEEQIQNTHGLSLLLFGNNKPDAPQVSLQPESTCPA